MTTIYLEPSKVPQHLRGAYSGQKFQAQVCESMTVPMDAGLWSGGSRESYRYVRLDDGAEVSVPGQTEAPWGKRSETTITLVPGYAVVRHSMFCGKDMGLTFYLHPANAAAMLPAPCELTAYESLVLYATSSFKSSYGGRDRYEMAQGDYGAGKRLAGAQYPTRAQWDDAKAALISRGFLNKNGAITPAGRNAGAGSVSAIGN